MASGTEDRGIHDPHEWLKASRSSHFYILSTQRFTRGLISQGWLDATYVAWYNELELKIGCKEKQLHAYWQC